VKWLVKRIMVGTSLEQAAGRLYAGPSSSANMMKYAPDGIHLAFEPVPDLYHGLANSFNSYPNVRV
jgi:hypothetical protein